MANKRQKMRINTFLFAYCIAILLLIQSPGHTEEVVRRVIENGRVYYINDTAVQAREKEAQKTQASVNAKHHQDEKLQNLRIKCEGKFGSNQEMVRYCMKAEINEELQAINKDIRRRCMDLYGPDYEKIKECQGQ